MDDLRMRVLPHCIKRKLVNVLVNDAAFRERLEGPIYDVNPDITRCILVVLVEPSVTKAMKGFRGAISQTNYIWMH